MVWSQSVKVSSMSVCSSVSFSSAAISLGDFLLPSMTTMYSA
jgi:hypothetical protein